MPVTVKRRQPTASLPVERIEITDASDDLLRIREGLLGGERLVASIVAGGRPETNGVLIEASDVEALRDALSDWLANR